MLQIQQVRVKRRRSEAPAPTLVVRPSKRKRTSDESAIDETDEVVFKLAESQPDAASSTSRPRTEEMVLERGIDARHLKIASGTPVESSEDLPNELRDMIKQYMQESSSTGAGAKGSDWDKETEDYVYDVYYSDRNAVADGLSAYIQLTREQEHLFFATEGSDDSDVFAGDDDDSNAEDYYANDYPDEVSSEDSLLAGLEDELGDLHIEDKWSEASD